MFAKARVRTHGHVADNLLYQHKGGVIGNNLTGELLDRTTVSPSTHTVFTSKPEHVFIGSPMSWRKLLQNLVSDSTEERTDTIKKKRRLIRKGNKTDDKRETDRMSFIQCSLTHLYV